MRRLASASTLIWSPDDPNDPGLVTWIEKKKVGKEKYTLIVTEQSVKISEIIILVSRRAV